jgi:hypothetical protein
MSSQVSMGTGTAGNISKSEVLNATGQGCFDLNVRNPSQAAAHQIGTADFDQPGYSQEIDDANALENYYSTAKPMEQPLTTQEKGILVHTKEFEEIESGRASLNRSSESPRKSILTNRSRGSLRRSSLERRDKDVTLTVSPSKLEINYSVGSSRKSSVSG